MSLCPKSGHPFCEEEGGGEGEGGRRRPPWRAGGSRFLFPCWGFACKTLKNKAGLSHLSCLPQLVCFPRRLWSCHWLTVAKWFHVLSAPPPPTRLQHHTHLCNEPELAIIQTRATELKTQLYDLMHRLGVFFFFLPKENLSDLGQVLVCHYVACNVLKLIFPLLQ